MVYVIDIYGDPLMPTERYGKVKWLLRKKRARVVKRTPFTIQLLYLPKTHCTQDVTLGVDAGGSIVGLSATTDKKELFSAEVKVRNDIPELMTERSEARRSRRGRLRHRKARFKNRKRPKGWLTPTMRNKISTHENAIADVCEILPVSRIVIETASFDIQQINAEDEKGLVYHDKESRSYKNRKLTRKAMDEFKCRNCGSTKELEVHHRIRRADGGTDRLENLVTLCHKCHTDYHDGKIELNIKEPDAESFKGAATMNTMRWKLLEAIRDEYPDKGVYETFGYITAETRNQLNLNKEHRIDAFCIAGNLQAERTVVVYDVTKVRCHNRKLFKSNTKKGGLRQRHQAPRTVRGFRIWDKVEYKGREAIVTCRKSDGRVNLKFADGSTEKHISMKKICLVEHSKTRIYMRRPDSAPTQG